MRPNRWPIVLAYVIMAAGAFFGLRAYEHDQNADRARFEQAAIDSDYRSCLAANNVRAILRGLVNLSGAGIDLTAVEGFDRLDADTQAWIRNVAKRSAPDDPGGFRSRALATLADRDCTAEFPRHSPALTPRR